MKTNLLIFICIIATLAFFSACKSTSKSTKAEGASKEAPCVIVPTYAKDIKPLIEMNCATKSCHHQMSNIGDFTNDDQVKAQADRGKIMKLVVDLKQMPPGSPLNDSDIQKIKCWLNNGAKIQ